jgi:glutamate---cysteine ligase / carboxylate-amine ligase
VLERTIVDGDRRWVDDGGYLRALGLDRGAMSAGDVWRRLVERHPPDDPLGEWIAPLRAILERGPLARRMLDAVGDDAGRADIESLYGDLSECLEANASF